MEVKCKHCKRYLFTAVDTVIIEKLVCSNSKCRARLNIKIVNSNSSDSQLKYKFGIDETPPKLTNSK